MCGSGSLQWQHRPVTSPQQWDWVGTALTGSGTSHLWRAYSDHGTCQANTGEACSPGSQGSGSDIAEHSCLSRKSGLGAGSRGSGHGAHIGPLAASSQGGTGRLEHRGGGSALGLQGWHMWLGMQTHMEQSGSFLGTGDWGWGAGVGKVGEPVVGPQSSGQGPRWLWGREKIRHL